MRGKTWSSALSVLATASGDQSDRKHRSMIYHFANAMGMSPDVTLFSIGHNQTSTSLASHVIPHTETGTRVPAGLNAVTETRILLCVKGIDK